MKKRLIRRKTLFKSKKVKNDKKYKYKYIKDKAIKNFILQHTKKPNIDFSKIKIPYFLEFSNDEESSNKLFLKDINLPIFRFKAFSDIKKEGENENRINSFFNSFSFKKTTKNE